MDYTVEFNLFKLFLSYFQHLVDILIQISFTEALGRLYLKHILMLVHEDRDTKNTIKNILWNPVFFFLIAIN